MTVTSPSRDAVSTHALTKVQDQVEKARKTKDLPPCTGHHQHVLGLPCSHVIARLIANRKPLTLAHIDARWCLTPSAPGAVRPLPEQQAPEHVIRDPHAVRARGRPASTGTSTRRDPSHFELVDPPASQQRMCSSCRQPGHNSRTCPLPRAGPRASQTAASSSQAPTVPIAAGPSSAGQACGQGSSQVPLF